MLIPLLNCLTTAGMLGQEPLKVEAPLYSICRFFWLFVCSIDSNSPMLHYSQSSILFCLKFHPIDRLAFVTTFVFYMAFVTIEMYTMLSPVAVYV